MSQELPTAVGLLAEFLGPEELMAAADRFRTEGYCKTDAFTPFPVDGMNEALGRQDSPLPWLVLAGGLTGGGSMYALAWWVSAIAYPLNVGGRPLHSWPSFIPPTFEGTILGAAIAAFLGVFILSRLPRLNHPVFEIDRFRRASTDAFFLWIPVSDTAFDAERTRGLLQELSAVTVWEVPTHD